MVCIGSPNASKLAEESILHPRRNKLIFCLTFAANYFFMLDLGKYSTLEVEKFEPHGAYLTDGKEDEGRVLLPGKYVPENLKPGDKITVFVYNDSEDRPVATTEKPYIELHHFAILRAKSVTKLGAFMDWGLSKDLLIPFKEQNKEIEEGRSYLVYLNMDYETDRLVGSTRLTKYLATEPVTVGEGEEVDLIVWTRTDLGYKVIINEIHLGLLYHTEIFQDLKLGQHIKGFVKTIREDKKIDVVLQRGGHLSIEPNAQKLLEILEDFGGFLNLNDKSDPDDIARILGMSKKLFKKSVGSLYKAKKIILEDGGIRLV
jgi:uncharacterized protein